MHPDHSIWNPSQPVFVVAGAQDAPRHVATTHTGPPADAWLSAVTRWSYARGPPADAWLSAVTRWSYAWGPLADAWHPAITRWSYAGATDAATADTAPDAFPDALWPDAYEPGPRANAFDAHTMVSASFWRCLGHARCRVPFPGASMGRPRAPF